MASTPPLDFLSVREAAAVLRIGKTCAYELAQQFVHTHGQSGLKVIRVGRQLRVPRTALEEMLGGSITWPIVQHTVADEATPEVSPTPVVAPDRRPKSRSARSEQSSQLFPL
jgi:excisionase family DNA binding protein